MQLRTYVTTSTTTTIDLKVWKHQIKAKYTHKNQLEVEQFDGEPFYHIYNILVRWVVTGYTWRKQWFEHINMHHF